MVSLRSLSVLLFAVLAAANTVTFISKDERDRTVYFHNDIACEAIDSITVAAGATEVVSFPEGWIGMWYAAVSGLADPGKGMLGEVTFNGWLNKTYFDVSAIDMPSDHDGVYKIWAVGDEEHVSGCDVFPCDTVYIHPDDVQTIVTDKTELVCTLGGP